MIATVQTKIVIGKTSNCLLRLMIERELFNNNQLRLNLFILAFLFWLVSFVQEGPRNHEIREIHEKIS